MIMMTLIAMMLSPTLITTLIMMIPMIIVFVILPVVTMIPAITMTIMCYLTLILNSRVRKLCSPLLEQIVERRVVAVLPGSAPAPCRPLSYPRSLSLSLSLHTRAQ